MKLVTTDFPRAKLDRPAVMVWNAARGGMRSVVETYVKDGLTDRENIHLLAAYCDGSLLKRQVLLARSLARFALLLATKRPRLVHIHVSMKGSLIRKSLFAMMARAAGTPVLLHMHGSETEQFYASLPPLAQRLMVGQIEAASKVLVLSESWRSFILGIAPRAQVCVIPNCVHMPELPAAERPADCILFLGQIGDRKGVFDLLPAFARALERHPSARLVLGGNGETSRAIAEIARLGLGQAVTLVGWVSGASKASLLAEAGIYVLPSYNEGLPVSVLEAMAEGLAVVTTRVGGIPELIHDGEHGLLVDAGDVDALASALSRLIEDRELRLLLASAGRQRIQQYYSSRPILRDLSLIYALASRIPAESGRRSEGNS